MINSQAAGRANHLVVTPAAVVRSDVDMECEPSPSPIVHRIDPGQAHEVEGALLDAPRASSDAVVRAAYAELGVQADQWFARVTDHRAQMPIRVEFTRCREPYESGQELEERVRSERVLELCPASFDRDR